MNVIDQELHEMIMDTVWEQFEQEMNKLFDEYEMKQEYSSYFNHTI